MYSGKQINGFWLMADIFWHSCLKHSSRAILSVCFHWSFDDLFIRDFERSFQSVVSFSKTKWTFNLQVNFLNLMACQRQWAFQRWFASGLIWLLHMLVIELLSVTVVGESRGDMERAKHFWCKNKWDPSYWLSVQQKNVCTFRGVNSGQSTGKCFCISDVLPVGRWNALINGLISVEGDGLCVLLKYNKYMMCGLSQIHGWLSEQWANVRLYESNQTAQIHLSVGNRRKKVIDNLVLFLLKYTTEIENSITTKSGEEQEKYSEWVMISLSIDWITDGNTEQQMDRKMNKDEFIDYR